MSRTIEVKDKHGDDDYVVVESGPHKGDTRFFLSTGVELHLESGERFENPISGLSYYPVSNEDVTWLHRL